MIATPKKFIFLRWVRQDEAVGPAAQSELTLGVFHGGSTFDGVMFLDPEDARQLAEAHIRGYRIEVEVSQEL